MPKIIKKTDLNGLSRFFRKKLRDPALHKLIGSKRDAIKYIEEDLPAQLLDLVPKLETQKQMPSWLKMSRLVEKSYYWLKSKNLLWLKPYLTQFLEHGVMYIYKEHFIEEMTKVGLHDEIEEFFNIDLDDSGKVGDEPVKLTDPLPKTTKSSGKKSPPKTEESQEKVWPPLKDDSPETETQD